MEKFYLGLDVGTESVGIACTDENYDLLRAKGKDLWAVRLFDEAQTGAERRLKRTARRRLVRRALRIDWLQEQFLPYMKDELFFVRLNNSGFGFEDKDERLGSAASLFSDKDFDDKSFHKKYPTVFHLRRDLITGSEKADLRLYYLAIHHIVKYRGHFLYEGQKTSEVRDIRKQFEALNREAEECFAEEIPYLDVSKADAFREIALSSELKSSEKRKKCLELFGAKESPLKDIVTLMLGYSAKLSAVFGNDEYGKESISFKKASEEELAAKQELLGDNFAYLERIKGIYDYTVFENILKGKAFISLAMTDIYSKHSDDLRRLKGFIKAHCDKDTYFKVFKSTADKGNYCSYIGKTKVGKKKVKVEKCKEVDEFYKFIAKILKEKEGDPEAAAMLAEIEERKFMPKIINADNGLFPYQINLDELDRLLANLVRDYPEFGEKGEDGLSAAEKIRKIFLFKIPYYVGPLGSRGDNVWAVKKSDERITPWNFDEIIDKGASNEKFMRRMTGKCSYLYLENTLPKHSVIYQKFNTLNRLNKVKIDGVPISVELKQEIFGELFCTHKKVTLKMLKNYLVEKGYVAPKKEVIIEGFNKEIDVSMSSYVTLKNILGDIADRRPEICEDIILWHTLNTDKRLVEKLMADKYGDVAEVMDNIKQLKGLNSFKEFGTLSAKLLCGLKGGIDYETGEVLSIIGALYNTNENFNQILENDKYTFKQLISEENAGLGDEVDYKALEDMRLSPSVRRGVWQAIKMADEYIAALGRNPDKIFVEVARGGGEKGKETESRKNRLLRLYDVAKETGSLIGELNGKTDSELRSERLYLYFLQRGKCMYTGKEISLDDLNGELYDVDHIMPRSITKDDSLDNKVLVYREANAKKADTYPVPEQYRSMSRFWKELKDSGLVSEKKYALLTRTAPLDENDFNDFINRQIVVTGQTAKAVAELLQRKYKDAKVVYSKAENVADFKNKYGIVKCRDTNDLHHARDAYLNIVVGNVYDTKFSSARAYYRKTDDGWREYNLKHLFDRSIAGAWKGSESVAAVKKTAARCSMSVTRYTFTGKGKFYDETVYSGKDGAVMPRKDTAPYTDVVRYGGFKSLKTAYFAVVESDGKKGAREKYIKPVPVLIDYKSKADPGIVLRYLTEYEGLKNPKILVGKIKIKTLLEVDGMPVYLAGVSGKRELLLHNAVQWYTDPATDDYVKALSKLFEANRKGMLTDAEKQANEYAVKTNRFKESKLLITKDRNLSLYDAIASQLGKKIYSGVSGAAFFRQKLAGGREKFIALSLFDQACVLLQLVKFLKCNAETADLTLIGDKSICGKLLINQKIDGKEIVIVNKSECGLTERRVKI